MQETVRIILVDDHKLVIHGIGALLRDDASIRIVANCNNGEEVMKTLEVFTPDIILMDIDMPVMNGLDTLQAIRKKRYQVRVIMLTQHREKALARKCRQLGANGYLLKTCERPELISAITDVMKGKLYFNEEDLDDDNAHEPSDNAAVVRAQITEREIEILRLIAEGLSNKEIGDKLFISHRTVDTHRTNLMKKLEVNNIAALIKKSFDLGLIR